MSVDICRESKRKKNIQMNDAQINDVTKTLPLPNESDVHYPDSDMIHTMNGYRPICRNRATIDCI